jgi:predicted porin
MMNKFLADRLSPLSTLLRLASLLALALLASSAAHAQQAATLTGTVTDSTAAVIPGAQVELVNPATGESYTASTEEAGSYTLLRIPGQVDHDSGVKAIRIPG